MGNEILARAAFDSGALVMFGYPITPTTEVLSTWVKLAEKYNRKYLQTEDEMAAGFGVCGVVLAGYRSFTATGGPGMILMQDPLVMAEAMRLPMVIFDGQRGGPSTGQVIYSQQELNLAIHGGNGEGLRIVYSPASLQDLYAYGKKAFDVAWKYRFPTILLYDGYQGKMKGEVDIPEVSNFQFPISNKEPLLTANMRNTYNLEEELSEVVLRDKKDFDEAKSDLIEYELFPEQEYDTLIVAHGIVAAAAKKAIGNLKVQGLRVSLFRPITLSPFPKLEAANAISKAKKVLFFESSLGQLASLVKSQIYGLGTEIVEIQKPGVGFTSEEIEEKIKKMI